MARGSYLSREYPERGAIARKLALCAVLMRHTRMIGGVSLVQILHLAPGNKVVKFRRVASAVYKDGSYAPT